MDQNDLLKAISWLMRLLDSNNATEADFQYYLESNPVVFEVLGYIDAKPFEKNPVIDFPLTQTGACGASQISFV
jgi:hypothetical protein